MVEGEQQAKMELESSYEIKDLGETRLILGMRINRNANGNIILSQRVYCERLLCYDSPWTGLLTSGDNGCHRWTAVGVSSDTLGGVNINRMTWEQSCQGHDMDT